MGLVPTLLFFQGDGETGGMGDKKLRIRVRSPFFAPNRLAAPLELEMTLHSEAVL